MTTSARRRFILTALAASGAALFPLSAIADGDKGKGKGKRKIRKGGSDSRGGGDQGGNRDEGNRGEGNWDGGDFAEGRGCPPGLAKKNPPCVPPGQAKKRGGGDREWWDRDWQRGEYVGDYDYHQVHYPGRYGLRPLPPGQNYMILGNRLVVVDSDTYRIMSVLNAVTSLLD